MASNGLRGAWWWIDRWRRSTAYTDMTLAEQGAYRNLLDELWLRDGLLPDDDRILAKISGDALAWPEVRDRVMAHFTRVEGGLRNETHDEISAESHRRAKKQRAYRERSRGGNAPGNASGNDARNVTHSPFSVLRSPSPSPDQQNNGQRIRETRPETRSDPGLFGAPDGGAPPEEGQSKVPAKRTEARTAARMATDGGETWPSAEAVDDWNDRYGAGTAPGGKITGPLTTLVRAQAKASGRLRANEWAVSVRPAWRRYLAESTHPAPNAEDFRQHFADWREGGRGAGGNGKPSSAQLYREACEALELRDAERGRGGVPAVDGGGRPTLPGDRT